MREIQSRDIRDNIFEMIEHEWFLITAEKKDGSINAMTAQWGTLGHLWGEDVVVIFVRPQRYTHEFVSEADSFSVCFFGEEHRSMMRYMGTVSGRDENKIEKENLKVEHLDGTPYFADARLAITCEKIYTDHLKKEGFNDQTLRDRVYPKEDFHTVIIGKIKHVLEA